MSDGSSHLKIKEEPPSDGEGNGNKNLVRIGSDDKGNGNKKIIRIGSSVEGNGNKRMVRIGSDVEGVQIIKTEGAQSTSGSAFKCNYCDSTFSSLTDLQTHETSHPTEQKVACCKCKKDFDVTETVKQLSIHGEECTVSLFVITTTRGTKETERPIQFSIKIFPCNDCRKATFESQAKLTEHRKKVHNICHKCGKMFEQQSILNGHLRFCKGGKRGPTIPPATTSEGAAGVPQKATGEKRKLSQDETPQSATKKRQGLPSSSEAAATITSEHPVGGIRPPYTVPKEVGEHSTTVRFFCEECRNRFQSVTDLEGHANEEHPGYRPFKCASICSKRFAKLDLLKQHYNQVHRYEP